MSVYAIYGWAATQPRYAIEFWNYLTKATTALVTGQGQNTYAYESSDDQPGLLLVYPLAGGTHRMRPYAFPVNNVPSMATLRWMARDALNDTATEDGVDIQYPAEPKWADRELNGYIQEAISYYGNYNALEYILETSTAHVRPEHFRHVREVLDVSYYDTRQQEWMKLTETGRHGHRGDQKSWEIVNGHLRLYGQFADPTELQIHVMAPYPMPIMDTHPIDIPFEDWDILSMYVQAKAYIRLAGQSAQLDRWKEEGKRNDNPVTPVARILLEQVDTRLKTRRGPRVIRRYRG